MNQKHLKKMTENKDNRYNNLNSKGKNRNKNVLRKLKKIRNI